MKMKILLPAIALLVSIAFNACKKDTCSDGEQNQDETGIDCGGECPDCIIAAETCTDGLQNQGETEIDCGGPCQSCGGVDTAGRGAIISDYNTNYLGSSVVSETELGWTGSVIGCVPGNISTTARMKVLNRINYFRRLAGLDDNITFDPTLDAKTQEAALMMAANNTLNHCVGTPDPCASFACYTATASEAARNSNIALGSNISGAGTDAITLWMEDEGGGNEAVGHRRWILHSKAQVLGFGSTNRSASLWINSFAGSSTPEFIAYPSKGFFPAPLVAARWSFGLPGADFSNATVTMKAPDNSNVNITLEAGNTAVGYGDNTIVWVPAGINTTSSADQTYVVSINNVIVNGAAQNFTYNVTIVQP